MKPTLKLQLIEGEISLSQFRRYTACEACMVDIVKAFALARMKRRLNPKALKLK